MAGSGDASRRAHARITLLRHGQSEWNLANRFTGWVDVDLTERGITEARAAGRLLADDGLQHDLVCTSTLRRAIRTACLVLSTTQEVWLPLVKDARLNEQHSGSLTGLNKRELADEHGVEQVMKWRRTYDSPPPPADRLHPIQASILADKRYRSGVHVPATESLADTLSRVAAVWEDTLRPALAAGKRVLVVSHGNTLRALVKLLDGVAEDETYNLDLPTACPVVYDLDVQLRPIGAHGFWGTSRVVRHGRYLMAVETVALAQQAMREQVVRNIAVSIVSRTGETDALSTCDAWTAAEASSSRVTLGADGETFNVRSTPPSYFALESERIKRQATHELQKFQLSAGAGIASDAASAAALGKRVSCMLILIRHGYSQFNADNRFTGWADVDLTNRGRDEARVAGSMLRAAGIVRIERVYTSMLRRAIKTAWLMLDELEMQWAPITHTWRLNERSYGGLQGRPKPECVVEYGMRQVQRWRRGINARPPPWDEETAAATIDRRYDGVPVPTAESLADCAARLQPFLDDELFPAMRKAIAREREREAAADAAAAAGVPADGAEQGDPGGDVPVFVISSSENLLRSLIAKLDGLAEVEVPLLDIPYATPIVFQLDAELQPLPNSLAVAPMRNGWYLGDAERIKGVQASIRAQLGRSAEPAHAAPSAAAAADVDDREASCYSVSCEDEHDLHAREECFVRYADSDQVAWVCDDDPASDSPPELTSVPRSFLV
ncbi:hypothetical protein KFE25_009454 [Diacronema lutheri]|uniref:Phosphoglycerate mutase n=1 Tax=Diacronema lutheri TaxID=2081491 RepID=A0A8J5XMN2_DIALT|nr:hypothetical protein KFE25_009454 [Diacronema lutheri]